MTATRSTERADLYRDARENFTALVRKLSPTQLARPVAVCPGWTVQDLVAHVVGSATDSVTGNVEGATTPPWTQAQVGARRGMPLDDLLDEWEEQGPVLEKKIRERSARGASLLILDLVTHELDIRGTVGDSATRDSSRQDLAWEIFLRALHQRIEAARVPALRIRLGDEEHIVGRGEPNGTVSGSRFELLRVISGRRSLAQIAALKWEGDPTTYLPLMSHFSPPESNIVE